MEREDDPGRGGGTVACGGVEDSTSKEEQSHPWLAKGHLLPWEQEEENQSWVRRGCT